MKEKKRILVFSYGNMLLGGIHKITYGYIKNFLEREGKVVWIAPEKRPVDPGYRELVNEQTITICTWADAEPIMKELCRDYEATVVMMSFYPADYLKMIKLERALREFDVRNYLIIPHYKGTHLLLEENYWGREKQRRFAIMKEFYQKLLDNKSIFFCSIKQVEAFGEHYQIPIEDKASYVLPASRLQEAPDDDAIRRRHGKQNIISVCRFSFPHKGYVLGLIRNYGILKEKYPDLKLTLIGLGEGAERVNKEIQKLSENARKDVCVIPGVPTEQLPKYYAEANVAVGLAGAASTSAADGLITLVARHYCEDGEVYGSYPECWEKTVCEEPGNAIIPELERILELDEAAYLEESRRTRQAYERRVLPRLKDICNDYSVDKKCILTEEQCDALEAMGLRAKKLLKLQRYISLLRQPGYILKKLTQKVTRSC